MAETCGAAPMSFAPWHGHHLHLRDVFTLDGRPIAQWRLIEAGHDDDVATDARAHALATERSN